MHYETIGISHKTAPVEIRERLAVSGAKAGELLHRLVMADEISEALIVSTCNRVETYLVGKHLERGTAIARRLLAEFSGSPEAGLEQ